ncbi:MAG TPA: DNA-3-methyladenine glycosylase 2 family protein [Burkholderiales bacterium]|nr:DNA-3-methyladenine glycosylase 2 family protein [Burkholderiales bacterium]
MTPEYWQQACRQLSRRDVVFRKLIKAYPGITLRSRNDAFHTLCRAIVGQQISVKAADSVWLRFAAAVEAVKPGHVLKTPTEQLRAAGLSGRKVEYLQDLARHFHEGLIIEAQWPKLTDDEIIADLVRVKGIGRWSAEMFLMFYLLRPNVAPLDDIGLQRAIQIQYNKGEPLSRAEMRTIAESWRPWSTVATWYLWRSLEPVPVEY